MVKLFLSNQSTAMFPKSVHVILAIGLYYKKLRSLTFKFCKVKQKQISLKMVAIIPAGSAVYTNVGH